MKEKLLEILTDWFDYKGSNDIAIVDGHGNWILEDLADAILAAGFLLSQDTLESIRSQNAHLND